MLLPQPCSVAGEERVHQEQEHQVCGVGGDVLLYSDLRNNWSLGGRLSGAQVTNQDLATRLAPQYLVLDREKGSEHVKLSRPTLGIT